MCFKLFRFKIERDIIPLVSLRYEQYLFTLIDEFRYKSQTQEILLTQQETSMRNWTLVRTPEKNKFEFFQATRNSTVIILRQMERIARIIDFESIIPQCDYERRPSRKITPGDENFKEMAEEVYRHGYNDRSNSGSTTNAGGQEQPITIASVRRLATKIHQLFPQKTNLKIKWVYLRLYDL